MTIDPRIKEEHEITLEVHGGVVFRTTEDGGEVSGR
jgi:hypothetical protein